MALLGSAVLAIWNDIAPGGDDEFIHWHTREHIPERVGVPGFLRGRRYVAVSGSPKYFTLYEAESLDTLSGGAYIARLNDPTPWTRQSLPLFRNTKRTACRVSLSLGLGMGGVLATLDFGPSAGRDGELHAWLTSTALRAIAERPGMVAAHLCEADVATTQVKTEEKKLRDPPDDLARWVLMIEGTGAESLEAVCRDVVGEDVLARQGATADSSLAIYRLQYVLAR
ncbi:MAG: hypothetical protein HY727_01135 [Candidatus Rokubacteria bacterium]|nr:hypothetical protein [Candidatus Rokubacteria bacterium]